MGTMPEKKERLRPARRDEIADYIEGLRAEHRKYDRPIDEARRIVDESMGTTRLTDLLYRSRRDDVR